MKEIAFDAFYQLYQNEQLSLVDVREVEEFGTLRLEGLITNLSVNWLIPMKSWTRTSCIMPFVNLGWD